MNPRLNKSRTFVKVRDKSITLIEMLIAMALLGLIVLGFASLDLFSRYHVLTSDERTKLQNEASYVLEHMTKEISKAISDVNQFPVDITSTINGDLAIKVWIDFSGNGMRDAYPVDREIAYRFTAASGSPSDRYQIWYYANCLGPNCNLSGSIGPETIAKKITTFNRSVTANYVNVDIGACWDPVTAVLPNGTPDNPCVNMSTNIKMPSVSTN